MTTRPAYSISEHDILTQNWEGLLGAILMDEVSLIKISNLDGLDGLLFFMTIMEMNSLGSLVFGPGYQDGIDL